MGFGHSKVKLSEIDMDGDGIITREEVVTFVQDEVGKWKTLLKEESAKKDEKIDEWKAAYEDMHAKYSELLERFRKKASGDSIGVQHVSAISPEAVEAAVEAILADPDLNLKKVPDWMEKKVYHNLIWITLMVVEKIMGSVRIDALGHEFYLALRPQDSFLSE
uniref:EF-hand domain-containing protein n=1 Tax=Pithovirus LCPAC304 TaxID=2506594 RepID=A0A481Z9G7_9VIRU|nr:MAG: hypothetical protein LCPAC304_03690 [Pithovirus LCPAC304]